MSQTGVATQVAHVPIPSSVPVFPSASGSTTLLSFLSSSVLPLVLGNFSSTATDVLDDDGETVLNFDGTPAVQFETAPVHRSPAPLYTLELEQSPTVSSSSGTATSVASLSSSDARVSGKYRLNRTRTGYGIRNLSGKSITIEVDTAEGRFSFWFRESGSHDDWTHLTRAPLKTKRIVAQSLEDRQTTYLPKQEIDAFYTITSV